MNKEPFGSYTLAMLSFDSKRNLKNRVDRSIAAVTHAYEQYRKEVPQHVPSIIIAGLATLPAITHMMYA